VLTQQGAAADYQEVRAGLQAIARGDRVEDLDHDPEPVAAALIRREVRIQRLAVYGNPTVNFGATLSGQRTSLQDRLPAGTSSA